MCPVKRSTLVAAFAQDRRRAPLAAEHVEEAQLPRDVAILDPLGRHGPHVAHNRL